MRKYLKRYLDDELEELLEYMGAVLIVGPRWCGKTNYNFRLSFSSDVKIKII